MSTHTYKKADESLPDKMTVYQDCVSLFNALPIDARKARLLLAKLVRLLSVGETFPSTESTLLFFSVLKLFQHHLNELRQLVYLAIKALTATSSDVLMVTLSIMKDVQNGDIVFRPNALRTLARVIDALTVHATERLFKNCIVDRNPHVLSAALVALYHLSPALKDVVRRWANEAQEALAAQKPFPEGQFQNQHLDFYLRFPLNTQFTQYHALGLLYVLRNHDRMALVKMLTQLSGGVLKNPLALIEVIRCCGRLSEDPALAAQFYPALQAWMGNASEMVSLEAAKTVLNGKNFGPDKDAEAVKVLAELLSAPRVITVFAAARELNRVAMVTPQKVVPVNAELEALVNHSNRLVATYAITTLLKTGSADTVDRLILTILLFMSDISDEFKIVVVDAIRMLTLKFPEKYKPMLSFLADVLRDDGGLHFKSTVVELLFDMVHFIPELREPALENLCEFIEDCEFPELAVRILHVLGVEGPKTANPTLYVRHIFNRVALENASVRAAAVDALLKFGYGDAELHSLVEVLLERSLGDADDEVRDRAAVLLRVLKSKTESVVLVDFLQPPKKYLLEALELQLVQYVSHGLSDDPFDSSAIPQYTEDEWREKALQKSEEEPKKEHVESAPSTSYADEMAQIEELASYGKLLHSSDKVELTEKETEFVVSVVKHVFAEHLVLQYEIENTLPDTQLSMVLVVSTPENELYEEEFILPVETLAPQSKGTLYVSFARADGIVPETFANTLSFTLKEVDPVTLQPLDEDDEGFQDEYQIEELEVSVGDFIVPLYVAEFDKVFAELGNEQSAIYTLLEDIQESVDGVVKVLLMTPIGGTESVPEDATNHKLKLFGRTISGERVAAVVSFVLRGGSVVAKAVVKGEGDILEVILEGIA